MRSLDPWRVTLSCLLVSNMIANGNNSKKESCFERHTEYLEKRLHDVWAVQHPNWGGGTRPADPESVVADVQGAVAEPVIPTGSTSFQSRSSWKGCIHTSSDMNIHLSHPTC